MNGRGVYIACGRNPRYTPPPPEPCDFCEKQHRWLCDAPTDAPGRTCDAKMCKAHVTCVVIGVDYCPNCAARRKRGEIR